MEDKHRLGKIAYATHQALSVRGDQKDFDELKDTSMEHWDAVAQAVYDEAPSTTSHLLYGMFLGALIASGLF